MADPLAVSAQDPSQRNSPLSDAVENESTVLIATAARVCYWNGERHEEGANVQTGSAIYECSLGHWVRRNPDS